jgi:hypothetical protein
MMRTKVLINNKYERLKYGLSLLFCAALILLITTRAYAAPIIINFDKDASNNDILAGQVINEEYAAWGVHIQIDNFDRTPTGVINPLEDFGTAFDSSDHTLPNAGGDEDLFTGLDSEGSGTTYGTTGNLLNPRDESLGNLLIIQESGQPDVNDMLINAVPDDEGARPAGTITFNFDSLINSFGFDFIDVEGEVEFNGGYFASFYNGGTMINQVLFAGFQGLDNTIVWGNNSVNRIDPSIILPSMPFDQVVIGLGGSGAVDNIVFTQVPEPSTLLLLGSGLVGLGFARRRFKR